MSGTGPLLAILGIGLAVRLFFLPASGFHNDLQAFEAWALTLTEHPLRDFYRTTSFADYPPGYFFVLLVVGWVFKGLVAVHAVAPDAYNVLGMLAKLPAIAMDLVDTWLLYAIAGRFAPRPVALGAAMLYAFNPASIYVSGVLGPGRQRLVGPRACGHVFPVERARRRALGGGENQRPRGLRLRSPFS